MPNARRPTGHWLIWITSWITLAALGAAIGIIGTEYFISKPDCSHEVSDDISLTLADACAIRMIKSRCEGLDVCFSRCFSSGKGINVGGGCGHICNYNWKVDWKAPEVTKHCYMFTNESYLPI